MVVLINMPFSSLFQPSLALSQFKSRLAGEGIPSRLLNLNFEFARRIGFKAYEPLEKLHAIDMRIGEWFFAREAWGYEFGPDARAFSQLCLNGLGTLGSSGWSVEWMEQVRNVLVPKYLDDMCDRILEGTPPDIAAFSCTFFQTVPALALARRIKLRNPGITTLFGGACLHGEMGAELIKTFPWMDMVATGEADRLIVPLVRAVTEGRSPQGLEGLLYREKGCGTVSGKPGPVTDNETFEALPVPDFDDFITDVRAFSDEEPVFKNAPVFLPFESSRGCWWGEKSQCAFCGLNSVNMAYRWKSPGKTLEQLETLAERYPVRRFFATDNNMPLSYYKDFLPRVRQSRALKSTTLFYEIKTNVKREWMKALSDAGVKHIQPGIETLSTPVLNCMRKGVSALTNIHLLKLCREFGITPMWNFLIRVPGESFEDYTSMTELVPKIVHFHPPTGFVRLVQLHRFSPYFRERVGFVRHVRAQDWYAGLFPEDRVDLDRVAYYFDAEWENTVGSDYRDYAPFVESVNTWTRTWCTFNQLPGLFYDVLGTGTLTLADTRFGRNGQWRLDPMESAIYRHLDDPVSLSGIVEKTGISVEQVRPVLDGFTAQGLALEESGTYLGLALPDVVASISLKHRRDIFRRFGRCS
jgi:ribosomal peptide maturation radical SAM protein 1